MATQWLAGCVLGTRREGHAECGQRRARPGGEGVEVECGSRRAGARGAGHRGSRNRVQVRQGDRSMALG